MMLADAISSATSEHAVYFLVTAYVESLHQFHGSLGISERVLALPVGNRDDLKQRLTLLRDEIDTTREGVLGAADLAAILECALGRLSALSHASPTAADEDARAAA